MPNNRLGESKYYKDLDIRELRKVKSLISFCNSLVLKDKEAAEENETLASYDASFDYVSAILKSDRLEDHYGKRINPSKVNVLSQEEKDELLESIRKDIINNYKELNPYYIELNKKYGISYFNARTAENFHIIHYRKGLLTEEQVGRFRTLYMSSLRYYNNVIFNESYTDYELYRNFSEFFIVFMSMERFITSELDVIHDYDIFDEKSLRNMFISYDLDHFYDLPIHYQRRLLKNLNELIKYKGTNTAIVNIVEIFGFENVKIFKHFLGKSFPTDPETNKVDYGNPDVGFYKIDYRDKNIQKEIQNYEKEDFDIFVSGDPFWHATKEEVLQEQFNLIQSKYFSIESSIDIVKYNTMISYLYSSLKHVEENYRTINMNTLLPGEMGEFGMISLLDLVVAINYLTLRELGYKDNIIKNPSSIAYIHGFNFDIHEVIEKYPEVFDVEDEDTRWIIETFEKYGGESVSLNEFIDTLENNFNLKDELECAMLNAKDYRTYTKIKCIYEFQFKSTSIRSIFGDFETYGEYLDYKNSDFFNYLNKEDLNISKLITEILITLEKSLGKAFSSLMESPVVAQFLREFVIVLIDIFKFYTTKLKDFDIIYSIRDPYNNTVKIRENLDITTQGVNEEYIHLIEEMEKNGYLSPKEKEVAKDLGIEWKNYIDSDCIAPELIQTLEGTLESNLLMKVTEKGNTGEFEISTIKKVLLEIYRQRESILRTESCVSPEMQEMMYVYLGLFLGRIISIDKVERTSTLSRNDKEIFKEAIIKNPPVLTPYNSCLLIHYDKGRSNTIISENTDKLNMVSEVPRTPTISRDEKMDYLKDILIVKPPILTPNAKFNSSQHLKMNSVLDEKSDRVSATEFTEVTTGIPSKEKSSLSDYVLIKKLK